MENKRAELISANGTRTPIAPKDATFSLDELYQLIECEMIEVVNVGERLMIVDEEGLLRSSKPNATASLLAGRTIVGNVVLCDVELFD